MNSYIDIRVLPDPEFKETVLINALYAKIHRVIPKVGNGRIGLSFPNYNKTLGDVLRVHGNATDLNALMAENWLTGLRDYCRISAIDSVPDNCQYRTVTRKQVKSAHNKRKRAVSKGWLTVQQAWEKFPDESSQKLKLPYAQIKSLSANSVMRVYIDHGELKSQPTEGEFSSYGLSKTATIPWF